MGKGEREIGERVRRLVRKKGKGEERMTAREDVEEEEERERIRVRQWGGLYRKGELERVYRITFGIWKGRRQSERMWFYMIINIDLDNI